MDGRDESLPPTAAAAGGAGAGDGDGAADQPPAAGQGTVVDHQRVLAQVTEMVAHQLSQLDRAASAVKHWGQQLQSLEAVPGVFTPSLQGQLQRAATDSRGLLAHLDGIAAAVGATHRHYTELRNACAPLPHGAWGAALAQEKLHMDFMRGTAEAIAAFRKLHAAAEAAKARASDAVPPRGVEAGAHHAPPAQPREGTGVRAGVWGGGGAPAAHPMTARGATPLPGRGRLPPPSPRGDEEGRVSAIEPGAGSGAAAAAGGAPAARGRGIKRSRDAEGSGGELPPLPLQRRPRVGVGAGDGGGGDAPASAAAAADSAPAAAPAATQTTRRGRQVAPPARYREPVDLGAWDSGADGSDDGGGSDGGGAAGTLVAAGDWPAANDELLAALVGLFGDGAWGTVASFLPSHSANSCERRWLDASAAVGRFMAHPLYVALARRAVLQGACCARRCGGSAAGGAHVAPHAGAGAAAAR